MVVRYHPYASAALYSPEIFSLFLILLIPQGLVQPEALSKLKKLNDLI
jgi:hypothetical protein